MQFKIEAEKFICFTYCLIIVTNIILLFILVAFLVI